MYKVLIFLLSSYVLFLVSSCFNEKANNFKKNKFVQLKTDEKLTGIWKIDSIGKGDVIVARKIPNTVRYEAIQFYGNKKLFTINKDGYEESRELGTYSYTTDSIFFKKKSGVVFQKFGYEITNKVNLTLTGVNFVNKEHPVLYLTKKE